MRPSRNGPSGIFFWFNDDWLITQQAVRLFLLAAIFVPALVPGFLGWFDPTKLSFLLRLSWSPRDIQFGLKLKF